MGREGIIFIVSVFLKNNWWIVGKKKNDQCVLFALGSCNQCSIDFSDLRVSRV